MKQSVDSKTITRAVLREELKNEIATLEERLGKAFDKRFDKVTNMLVDVAGHLQVIREEMTIGTHQVHELREIADNHEKRISKLEAS